MKKVYKLFVLLICLTQARGLYAQKDSSRYELYDFSIGLNGSVLQAGRTKAVGYRYVYWADQSRNTFRHGFNRSFNKAFTTYSYGVNSKIRFYKNFFAEIGLNYSEMGYQTGLIDTVRFMHSYLYYGNQIGVQLTGNYIRSYEYTFKYAMISLPVEISYVYKPKNKRFFFDVGAGASLMYCKKETILETKSGQTKVFSVKDNYAFERPFNRIYYVFYRAHLGFNYLVSKDLYVSVTPVFNLVSHDSRINSSLYSGGLQMSLNLNL